MPYMPDRNRKASRQKRQVKYSQTSSQSARIAQAKRARLNQIHAKKRRKARRRKIATRLFTMLVALVIIITLSVFLWSKKDNIKSSLSAVTGLFKVERNDNDNVDQNGEKPEESQNAAETNPLPDDTTPDYGADGYDFRLEPAVSPFMGEERAIVLIDPGHGGMDGGAPGYLDDGTQVTEIDIVLDLAFKLKTELESKNIETYMIREEDDFHSLYSRVARVSILSLDYMSAEQPELVDDRDYVKQMIEELMVPIEINSDNPDSGGFGFMKGYGMSDKQMELLDLQQKCDNVIFISLHCNAHEYDTSLHGLQAYYCDDDIVEEDEAEGLLQQTDPAGNSVYQGRNNERNELLAQHVYDGTVSKAPFLADTNAGKPVIAGNYAVLREHGLAGTLLEIGYMSNSSDLRQLMDSQVQDKIAAGIGVGVEKYFREIFSS